jgi:hypothetical protein
VDAAFGLDAASQDLISIVGPLLVALVGQRGGARCDDAVRGGLRLRTCGRPVADPGWGGAGLLLSLTAVGALLGAVGYGTVARRIPPARRLLLGRWRTRLR